jgi:hypothetical protein
MRTAAGPHHLGQHIDPSYYYLFNGLRWAMGLELHLPAHPGIPLHLIIAAVIRITGLAAGAADLPALVVGAPEAMLGKVAMVHAALLGIGLFSLGKTLLPTCGPLATASTQLLLMGSVSGWQEGQIVKPEGLFFAAAPLFFAVLWRSLIAPEKKGGRAEALAPVLGGVALGAWILLKVTALPVLAFALLAPSWRARLTALFAAAATFLGILIAPFSNPAFFLGYAAEIGQFKGYNMPRPGHGLFSKFQDGVVGTTLALGKEPFLLVVLGLAIYWVVKRWRTEKEGLGALIADPLFVSCAVVAGGLLLNVVGPGGLKSRFLVPTLIAFGFLPAAMASGRAALKSPQAIQRVLLALTAAAALTSFGRALFVVGDAAERRASLGNVEALAPCQGRSLLFGWGVSDPGYALLYGNHWGGSFTAEKVAPLVPRRALLTPALLEVIELDGSRIPLERYLHLAGGQVCVAHWDEFAPAFQRSDGYAEAIVVGKAQEHTVVLLKARPKKR